MADLNAIRRNAARSYEESAMERLTLELNLFGAPKWKVRMFLFRKLVGLACRILGCGMSVNVEEEANANDC